MKQAFKNFLKFNNSQKTGTILLAFIVLILLCIRIGASYHPFTKNNKKELVSRADSLFLHSRNTAKNQQDKEVSSRSKKQKNKLSPSPFDPNTISMEKGIAMGIPIKVMNNLIHYRTKGGYIRQKSDLKKIYGVSTNLYQQLSPYIKIPAPSIEASQKTKTKKPSTSPKKDNPYCFEINKTPVDSLILIKGIGEYTAKKIKWYGSMLGGYYNIKQVYEIKKLDSVRIQKFVSHLKADTNLIKKIQLNKANFNQLNKHPYISYEQASKIVRYRRVSGNFIELRGLIQKGIFTEEELSRIAPYLSL